MWRSVLRVLALVALSAMALLAACAPPGPPAPPPTPVPRLATVVDLSVPFTASESSALRGRFLGLADLGRLDVGCQVEVLETTDRAARVRLLSYPPDTTTGVERRAPIGSHGWLLKSALDPEP